MISQKKSIYIVYFTKFTYLCSKIQFLPIIFIWKCHTLVDLAFRTQYASNLPNIGCNSFFSLFHISEKKKKTNLISTRKWAPLATTYCSTRRATAVDPVVFGSNVGLLALTKLTKQPSSAIARFTQDPRIHLSD